MPFGFTFESPDGKVLWQFDLDPDRYWIDGNALSYGIVGHFAILVFAEPEEGARRYDEVSSSEVASAPFSAAVIDLRTGTIASTLALGDRPAYEAQIEAIDEHGLLLSADFDVEELYLASQSYLTNRYFLYVSFGSAVGQ